MALHVGYGWSHRHWQRKSIAFTGSMSTWWQPLRWIRRKRVRKVLPQPMRISSLLGKGRAALSWFTGRPAFSDTSVNIGFKFFQCWCLGLRSLMSSLFWTWVFPDTGPYSCWLTLKFPYRPHLCRIESQITKEVLQVGLNIGQTEWSGAGLCQTSQLSCSLH